jgi:hypothetical protein
MDANVEPNRFNRLFDNNTVVWKLAFIGVHSRLDWKGEFWGVPAIYFFNKQSCVLMPIHIQGYKNRRFVLREETWVME